MPIMKRMLFFFVSDLLFLFPVLWGLVRAFYKAEKQLMGHWGLTDKDYLTQT